LSTTYFSQSLSVRLTRSSFSAIRQHCRHLTKLQWKPLAKQSVEWLALLLKCHLTNIHIDSSRQLNENEISILQHFHELKTLAIGYPQKSHLAPSPLSTTTTADWWPQLETLTLSHCDDIDDTTLIGFIKSHTKLSDIQLWFENRSNGISDLVLDAIVEYLPGLTRLKILNSDMENITTGGLQRLICGCMTLKHLYLSHTIQCGEINFDEYELNVIRQGAYL
jgi:hypothetical protein